MPGEAGHAGESGGARREGLSIRPQVLQLTPQYRRLRDAILRPQVRLTESRYFWERWKPLLGPDATVLIMEVRDRCNRALATHPAASGEAAGAPRPGPYGAAGVAGAPPPAPALAPWGTPPATGGAGCTVSAAELAAACGFSRVTLWRLLQRDDVRRFVRVEHNYVYDRRLGKKRRTVSTYHVLMEDPLVEADEPRLQEMLDSHLAQLAGPGARPACPPSTVHFATEVVDNPPRRLQPETNRGGSIPKPQNVSETISKERWRLSDETALAPPAPNVLAGQPALVPELADGVRIERRPRRHQPAPEVDIWRKYPELAHYVEEAEALLGDAHSRGFYLKTLQRLYPGHLGIWQRALGLAREQQHIRRSRGALFTRLLRTFAAEAGVTL